MRLLSHSMAARVLEVGDFGGVTKAILVFNGERKLSIPVTDEEARALGSRLYTDIRIRIAVDEPGASRQGTGGEGA